jgi:hypothetical protein
MDAQILLDFANLKGLSNLSMWAFQRDNGGCPGNTGANNCSGIAQNILGLQPSAESVHAVGASPGCGTPR